MAEKTKTVEEQLKEAKSELASASAELGKVQKELAESKVECEKLSDDLEISETTLKATTDTNTAHEVNAASCANLIESLSGSIEEKNAAIAELKAQEQNVEKRASAKLAVMAAAAGMNIPLKLEGSISEKLEDEHKPPAEASRRDRLKAVFQKQLRSIGMLQIG